MEKERVVFASTAHRRFLGRLLVLFLVLFLIWGIIIFAISPTLFRPGMASGYDTGSYLFTAKYLVDYLVENHHLPNINPYWYCGFEVLHNSPPLIYPFLGLIYFLFGDILLASRLFHILILGMMGMTMFFVIYKKHSLGNALAGAVLFPLTPAVLNQVVEGGSYTRASSLIFLPLIFYYINRTLEEDATRRSSFSLLVIFLSVSILGHPMVGASFLIFLTIYVVARLSFDKNLRSFTFTYWLLACVLALILTSWYLLPYFSEQIAWSALPEAVYKMNSISLSTQLLWLSFPFLVSIILTIFIRKSPIVNSLFLSGVFSMLFALGAFFPLNQFLPFTRSIYPFIGLLFAAFAFSYIVGTALDLGNLAAKSKFIGAIAIVIIIAVAMVQGYLYTKSGLEKIASYYNPADVEIASQLSKLTNKGRIMPMKYPFTYLLWWITVEGKKPMVEGWYYSLTPTGKHIAWLYDTIDNGYPEYAVDKFSYWNVRYLLTTGNFQGRRYRKFLNLLKKDGFKKASDIKGYTLYSKKGSAYIAPLDKKVLVVGRYASRAAPILSDSVVGGKIYIDDYDLKSLQFFDALVLYGFGYRDEKKATELVKSYVKAGGRVIIDLEGFKGNPLAKHPGFLGVDPVPISIERDASFIKARKDPLLKNFNLTSSNFFLKKEAWSSFAYIGLDKSLLKLKFQGETHDILGYKKIFGEKVYFVGANLFYHAYLNHNGSEIELLRNLVDVSRPQSPIGANTNIMKEKIKPEHIRFAYSSDLDLPLLVSFTYSPHWKAYLDGKEIKIYNIEDLMFLSLPAGDHTVKLKYDSTPIHFYANGLSLLTLAFLGWLLFKSRKPKPE